MFWAPAGNFLRVPEAVSCRVSQGEQLWQHSPGLAALGTGFSQDGSQGGMRETSPASSQATLGCPRVRDRGQGASPGQPCPFLESLSSETPLRSNPTVPPAPPGPPLIRVPIVTSTGLFNPRSDGDSSVPSFLPVREFSPDLPWHRRQSLAQGLLKCALPCPHV